VISLNAILLPLRNGLGKEQSGLSELYIYVKTIFLFAEEQDKGEWG